MKTGGQSDSQTDRQTTKIAVAKFQCYLGRGLSDALVLFNASLGEPGAEKKVTKKQRKDGL